MLQHSEYVSRCVDWLWFLSTVRHGCCESFCPLLDRSGSEGGSEGLSASDGMPWSRIAHPAIETSLKFFVDSHASPLPLCYMILHWNSVDSSNSCDMVWWISDGMCHLMKNAGGMLMDLGWDSDPSSHASFVQAVLLDPQWPRPRFTKTIPYFGGLGRMQRWQWFRPGEHLSKCLQIWKVAKQ